MATFHVSLTHHTRGNGSPRASQQAAYILRQEHAYNAVADRYGWTARHLRPDYGEDLTYATWGHLPAWSENKPVEFFAAADEYERTNGRLASSLIVLLPRELPHHQHVSIMQDWCALSYPTHPHILALHATTAYDGNRHPHAHIVYSIRRTDGIERTPRQHFARWNAAHPERGGAQKDIAFDAYGYIRAQRHAYSDLMNWHLEAAGQQTFLDPRSLHGREIPRAPEIQLPSFHGLQAKQRGIISPQWQAMLDQRVRNQGTRTLEEQKAREWWAYRKALLGSPGSPEALVAAVHHNRVLETSQFQHPGVVLPRGETPLAQHEAAILGSIHSHGQARVQGKPLTGQQRAAVQALLLRGERLITTITQERQSHDRTR